MQAVTMKMQHRRLLSAGGPIICRVGIHDLIAQTICKNIVKPMGIVDACKEKIFTVPYRFFL